VYWNLREIYYIMTVEEVAECKKYAESKGFVLFHFADEIGEEDIIYMENKDDCYNQVCNFFDDVVAMHHLQYKPEISYLRLSARSDEVETVVAFKVLLDNLIIRWKACKEEIKLYKLKEDF